MKKKATKDLGEATRASVKKEMAKTPTKREAIDDPVRLR
jgi:hypothetical protein